MSTATWASNAWVWVVSFKRLDIAAPDLPALLTKERPILFRGEMVRAILEGRKTQTRRVVKGSPAECFPMKGRDNRPDGTFFVSRPDSDRVGNSGVQCPYGKPGDRLWVRETWGLQTYGDESDWYDGSIAGLSESDVRGRWEVTHRADWGPRQDGCVWRPSIHMPRWACRLVLEVTDVRVERLQDISEEDAKAEGIRHVDYGANAHGWTGTDESVLHNAPSHAFRSLWESIHGGGP